MAYSEAILKSSGDRESPCFRPFWIGKLLDKFYPCGFYCTFNLNTFSISLTNFMGIPNSMRILYGTSLLIVFLEVYELLIYYIIVLPFLFQYLRNVSS
jgi:hypothetical protein